MALLSEMIVGTKISESAYLCLRLAWLYEGRVTELIKAEKQINSVNKNNILKNPQLEYVEDA